MPLQAAGKGPMGRETDPGTFSYKYLVTCSPSGGYGAEEGAPRPPTEEASRSFTFRETTTVRAGRRDPGRRPGARGAGGWALTTWAGCRRRWRGGGERGRGGRRSTRKAGRRSQSKEGPAAFGTGDAVAGAVADPRRSTGPSRVARAPRRWRPDPRQGDPGRRLTSPGAGTYPGEGALQVNLSPPPGSAAAGGGRRRAPPLPQNARSTTGAAAG